MACRGAPECVLSLRADTWVRPYKKQNYLYERILVLACAAQAAKPMLPEF